MIIYYKVLNTLPKLLSPLHTVSLLVLSVALNNCVATSDWLATPSQPSSLDPDNTYIFIRTGVTSKQEVLNNLRSPSHQLFHSDDKDQIESLSFSFAETEVRPSQYLPFLGGIPFLKSFPHLDPSIAISFSSQGTVSGLTFSTVNAHGDIPSSQIFLDAKPASSFFGMRNPDVTHSPTKKNLRIP